MEMVLDDEVFVAKPPSVEVNKQERETPKLRKTFYGKKQEGKRKRIYDLQREIGFINCVSKHESTSIEFKRDTMKEFEMINLYHLSYFFGRDSKSLQTLVEMEQCNLTITHPWS